MGFVSPTPIQARTVPIALLGKDICASAATGTGEQLMDDMRTHTHTHTHAHTHTHIHTHTHTLSHTQIHIRDFINSSLDQFRATLAELLADLQWVGKTQHGTQILPRAKQIIAQNIH